MFIYMQRLLLELIILLLFSLWNVLTCHLLYVFIMCIMSALLSHGSCHTSETVLSVSMCVRLLERSPNTLRSETSNCTSLPFDAPHMVTNVLGTIQSLQDIKNLQQDLQCGSDLVDFNSSLDVLAFIPGFIWDRHDLDLTWDYHSQDVRLLVTCKNDDFVMSFSDA